MLVIAIASAVSSCAGDSANTAVAPTIGTFAGLNGTVWETLYRVPLAGAAVAMSGVRMTTGSDGHYFFSDIPGGHSVLTVQRPGYLNFSGVVSLEGARTLDVVLKASNAVRWAGRWTGAWNTTSLSRTGGLTMAIAVNTIAATLQTDVDINGNLVGDYDPPGDVFPGVLSSADAVHISRQSPVYGLVTVDITTDGRIVGNATRIPIGTATGMDFIGTITATTATIDYTIAFSDGTTARGTATFVKN